MLDYSRSARDDWQKYLSVERDSSGGILSSVFAAKHRYTGKVIEIDSRIDAASRAFHVRADLPNEDGALPAGMFMQVSMSLTGGETTVIPEEAVIAESGAAYVFVVEEDKASRRQIELGRRAFGIVEVVSGIDADALVVTRGISKLRDGMSVKIKRADAGTGSGG